MKTRSDRAITIVAACGLTLAACGFASPARAADAPTDPASATPPAQPSLDDLLNIKPPPSPAPAKPAESPEPTSDTPAPTAADQPKVELPKEKAGDLFVAAIADMKQAATMLGEQNDPGIETQRTQERAINRLNQLLDQLRQQQQQQSKSQSQQQDTGSEQNQSQQQQQQQQQANSQSNQSRDTADRMMGTEDGQRNETELAEKLAEWGNLPDRIRDQLLQGDDDTYSRLYQKLTERYYQRLAEEAP